MARNDIEKEILKIVKENRIIWKSKVFGLIKNKIPSAQNSTINARVKSLTNYKEIGLIDSDAYYFLTKKKTQKNHTFLCTISNYKKVDKLIEINEHISIVSDKDKNNHAKIFALNTIGGRIKIPLYASQINNLSKLINEVSLEVGEKIVQVLSQKMFEYHELPSDKKKFQKDILEFLKNNLQIHNNTHYHCIQLLAIFNNVEILDILKKCIDLYPSWDDIEGRGYFFWNISKIVCDNKKELTNFATTLDNQEKMNNIMRIINSAEENKSKYKKEIKKFKK